MIGFFHREHFFFFENWASGNTITQTSGNNNNNSSCALSCQGKADVRRQKKTSHHSNPHLTEKTHWGSIKPNIFLGPSKHQGRVCRPGQAKPLHGGEKRGQDRDLKTGHLGNFFCIDQPKTQHPAFLRYSDYLSPIYIKVETPHLNWGLIFFKEKSYPQTKKNSSIGPWGLSAHWEKSLYVRFASSCLSSEEWGDMIHKSSPWRLASKTTLGQVNSMGFL